MGVMKRDPYLGQATYRDYAKISKAQWAELYRDLYAQTHGEDVVEEFMTDAQHRLEMLKVNGLAGG